MDAHALRVLEFEAVLQMLASETAFGAGHGLALALRPATELEEVLERQRLTAEARELHRQGIDLPFGGVTDIRELAHAAGIGQVLEPAELLQATRTLRTAWRARAVLERVRDRVPHLAALGAAIADLRPIADGVEAAIGPDGLVLDGASEALGAVRRELRVAHDRLEQRAQAALADAIRKDLTQEPLLTERNGRKVIPVKADFRGRIQGIVHDVSSSGATVFLEPMALVEPGNRVRELRLSEDREVRRVLQRLSGSLGERAQEAAASVEALAQLDLWMSAARLAKRLRCGLPQPGQAEGWLADHGETRLHLARHPLLTGDPVAIDLEVGGEVAGLLITGPNTGGKTVALKTLGLLTLMAQAGLPVPCAEESRLRVYVQVFADIGDEQSIQQSLSTFSSHMRNIIRILEEARPGTLALLDELGAGTDPTEGAALGRAIVDVLLERGCTVVATTHHGELKSFAHADPRLRNASVEFDLQTLSPTFHVALGLPGQSNALAIAERLGLGGEVLSRARQQLSPQHFELKAMLAEIRSQRLAAAEARQGADQARAEIDSLRRSLAERRQRIEEERAAIAEEATREAQAELAALRRDLPEGRRQAASHQYDPRAAAETLKSVEERLAGMRSRARPEPQVPAYPPEIASLHPGDTIHVRDIPQAGEALSGVGEDGKVEAQFGGLRMKVGVDRIDHVERATPAPTAPAAFDYSRPAVKIELDLRGQRADDALLSCEQYLDDAFRAGLPFVRIIHGKGTGALRATIREALTGHPLVRSFESAQQNDGGEGVTVAILAG